MYDSNQPAGPVSAVYGIFSQALGLYGDLEKQKLEARIRESENKQAATLAAIDRKANIQALMQSSQIGNTPLSYNAVGLVISVLVLGVAVYSLRK